MLIEFLRRSWGLEKNCTEDGKLVLRDSVTGH